jgi:NADP-dependent 3-hydroxy acid dehydrogenase YdfG
LIKRFKEEQNNKIIATQCNPNGKGKGKLADVTGGAGFIGSAISQELFSHGWIVRALGK